MSPERPPAHSVYGALTQTHALPGVTILPLRLFMGLTFIYAGIQKLTDPGFFKAGAPTYIGAQILAYSRGSPIQFLLRHLMEHAVPIGILTIITEIAIGALVLVGLFTRPAALVGLVLNLMFFLSASWHTYPYFFGSDIVFVMCWLTLALTGPGALALDTLAQLPLRAELSRRLAPQMGNLAQALITGPVPDAPNGVPAAGRSRLLTRGEVLLGAAASLILVVLGLVQRGTTSGQAGAPLASGAASSGATRRAGGTAAIPAGAKKIGNTSQLPNNSAGMVNDPQTGDPVIVVHTSGSNFYAYDAVCTHAGCTVQYDPQQQMIVCPCHGGTFDPAHGAQVVAGPPPSPLAPITMKIDSQGNIFIV